MNAVNTREIALPALPSVTIVPPEKAQKATDSPASAH
jgi:hypothetical protein